MNGELGNSGNKMEQVGVMMSHLLHTPLQVSHRQEIPITGHLVEKPLHLLWFNQLQPPPTM